MFKHTVIFMIGAVLLATTVLADAESCDPAQVETLTKMGEHFNTIVSVFKMAEEKDRRCGPDHCIRYYTHKVVQDNVDGAKALNGQNVAVSDAIPILYSIAENSANILTKAMSVCKICDRCASKASCTAPKPQWGY